MEKVGSGINIPDPQHCNQSIYALAFRRKTIKFSSDFVESGVTALSVVCRDGSVLPVVESGVTALAVVESAVWYFLL